MLFHVPGMPLGNGKCGLLGLLPCTSPQQYITHCNRHSSELDFNPKVEESYFSYEKPFLISELIPHNWFDYSALLKD